MPGTSAKIPEKAKMILVIEDERSIRNMLRIVLEQAGFVVETARDGIEGLRMTFEFSPDLVITDIIMPGMTGLQYLQTLRATIPIEKLPVIIASALGSAQEVAKGIALGASNYLIKPLSFPELLAKVQLSLHKPIHPQNELVDRRVGIQPKDAIQKIRTGDRFDMGKYMILDEIGSGGMATIYRAEHLGYRIDVALKVLIPKLALDPNHIMRFLREARILGQLVHPNIVRTFDIGVRGKHCFYAMELLDEPSLHAVYSQSGSLGEKRVVEIALKLSDALMHMHQKEIIHRDIKPANIIQLGDGRVKLLDFGLACFLSDKRLTQKGSFFGSPAYAAPENIRGHDYLTPASDIYSLGVTLYVLTMGELPFGEIKDPKEVFKMHCQKDLPSLYEAKPGTSRRFSRLISRMTSRSAKQRCASMADVREELRRCAAGFLDK